MGFDIAETGITSGQDREDLFNEIVHLIDNYSSIKQEPLGFSSVGCYNIEDMSHAYSPGMIQQLNETHDEL